MMIIIAHHYVVNSGITEYFDYSNITPNMIFLQLWGMWGKTAINVFVMITGYFMCRSRFTVKRFAKIYLESKFYAIVIFMILLACGYEQIAPKNLFKLLFGHVYGIGNSFTASFLAFYMFIPFYNKLLDSLNKREHLIFITLLLSVYTGTSTFFFSKVFSEPAWYVVLYFVAAYIRLYGSGTWLGNNKIIGSALIGVVCVAYASVIVVDYVGSKIGATGWAYMVSDSNKLLAFLIGAGTFLFFNNIKMKNSRAVNAVAASTFGVLCIHANSDAMRYWLWKEVLNVSGMYTSGLTELAMHAFLSMILIFGICSVIDMARIRLIEAPVFRFLDRYGWFNLEL